MVENEVFQTRLADDRAHAVHQFMDGKNISKAEATRRLIHAGLEVAEDDQDDQNDVDEAEDAGRDRTDRLTALARLAEKTAILTVAFSLTSLLAPLVAIAGIVGLGLTVGTFGFYLIVGVSFVAAGAAVAAFFASSALLAYLVAAHRIEAGWFGRRLETVLAKGEVAA
jgi:hypothetical protein